MASSRRDMKQLMKEVQARGHQVTVSGGGHLKVQPSGGGQTVFLAFSPSDHRTVLNSRALLRRKGLL